MNNNEMRIVANATAAMQSVLDIPVTTWTTEARLGLTIEFDTYAEQQSYVRPIMRAVADKLQLTGGAISVMAFHAPAASGKYTLNVWIERSMI